MEGVSQQLEHVIIVKLVIFGTQLHLHAKFVHSISGAWEELLLLQLHVLHVLQPHAYLARDSLETVQHVMLASALMQLHLMQRNVLPAWVVDLILWVARLPVQPAILLTVPLALLRVETVPLAPQEEDGMESLLPALIVVQEIILTEELWHVPCAPF